MTDNNNEEIQKNRINLYIRTLEESIELCNAIRTIKYIRAIDQFSNMDSLTRYKVDPLKAIDMKRQADEKVKELMNKFDKKCDCIIKTKEWEPPIPTEVMG